MLDIKVPQSQWQDHFEGFTTQHTGWLVGVSSLKTSELKNNSTANSLIQDYKHLVKVSSVENNGHIDLHITIGEKNNETNVEIENVLAIYERRIGEAHEGLRIDTNNNTTYLIEFRIAADPETLDGLAVFDEQ